MEKFNLKGMDAKTLWHKATSNYSHWISFIFLLLIAVLVNPSFLSYKNMTNLFVQGSIVGICAMGMSLIISAGMIDLSTGSAVAIISGLSVSILNSTQSIMVSLAFCLTFGVVLGLVNGILITKGNIAPFIVTLATMSAYRSIINQIGQGGPFTVDKSMYDAYRMITAGKLFGVPNLMIFFIIITLITGFIMTKTKFGRYVYSIGSNEHASRLTGINVDKIKITIYAYAGLLYGLAAFLLASRLTSIQAASAGDSYELDAIAAVAIGGTSMSGGKGKIIGTFLGILMLRIISTVLVMANVPPFLNGFVRGVTIIIAVLAQSRKRSNRMEASS